MKDTILSLAAFALVVFASFSFAGDGQNDISFNAAFDQKEYKSIAELQQHLDIPSMNAVALADSPVLPRPDTLPKPAPPKPDSIPQP